MGIRVLAIFLDNFSAFFDRDHVHSVTKQRNGETATGIFLYPDFVFSETRKNSPEFFSASETEYMYRKKTIRKE